MINRNGYGEPDCCGLGRVIQDVGACLRKRCLSGEVEAQQVLSLGRKDRMKGRAPPAKKIAVREESKSPMRQPKVRGKVKAEEKDEKFLGDGSSMEDAKRRCEIPVPLETWLVLPFANKERFPTGSQLDLNSRPRPYDAFLGRRVSPFSPFPLLLCRGQSQVRRSSFVLREAVANATAKEVDAWMARQGAGTTVYQHRFDHKVKDYSLDASNYHMTPSIVDFPVQAINPSLHKPNTLVHIDIVSFKVSLGKIMVELFENEAPRTCANFKSLCIGDNEKGLSYSGCRFHKVAAPSPVYPICVRCVRTPEQALMI